MTTAGSPQRYWGRRPSRLLACRGSASPTPPWLPPRAGFGDQEAYPTLIEKAAVLVEHLARNHPLPDGNKRCAFLALERFLAANGQPILDADPDTDVPMLERIAAGVVGRDEVVEWLQRRTASSP